MKTHQRPLWQRNQRDFSNACWCSRGPCKLIMITLLLQVSSWIDTVGIVVEAVWRGALIFGASCYLGGDRRFIGMFFWDHSEVCLASATKAIYLPFGLCTEWEISGEETVFFVFVFCFLFFLKSPFLLISIEGRGGGKLLTCVCLRSAPRSSPPKFGLVYVMTDGGIFLLNFPILCIHTHALSHTHTHTRKNTKLTHAKRLPLPVQYGYGTWPK